jgi:hypothetical protein
MNLLNLALGAIASVVPPITVTWSKWVSRTQNDRGDWVHTYAESPIVGSWQPVPLTRVKELGLDMSKRYHTLYTSHDVGMVNRGKAPDKITHPDGTVHEVAGIPAEWFNQNGWRAILCVEQGNGPG